jgi:hypothetical protein
VEVVPSIGEESRLSSEKIRGLDTLLELRLYVSLSDTSGNAEDADRCLPRLLTRITATLRRVSDGTILAKNSFLADSRGTFERPLRFQQMLTDESAIVQAFDAQFIFIANMIVKWISPSRP